MTQKMTKAKKSHRRKGAKRSPKRPNVKFQKSIVSLGRGFPKKIEVTHTYSDAIALTSTTGIIRNYIYLCNGMWDPDTTGTGHQPLYFDQMTTLYDHYVVVGSKCTYEYIPFTAAQAAAAFASYIGDDSSILPTTAVAESEYPTGQCKLMTVGATNSIKGTLTWSAKKYFGNGILANTELQGTVSTNPTEQSHFVFSLQAVDQASTISGYLRVKISYIAIWKEVKEVAQS